MNEQTRLTLENYESILHTKKRIVTLCVLVICIIDQIMGSAYGEVQMVAVNLTGFCVAGLILIHYSARDFLLPAHGIWAVICLIGGFLYLRPVQLSVSSWQWITAALNVWIYGHISIQTFYYYFLRRKAPKMRWVLFALWCIMMLGMIFSRNDSLWPLWFLVMFGCFYLTDYTRDEKDCIFDGLMNGIIIAFFLLQGFAVLYRLYDTVRYTGIYTNSNMNALFYLITGAAVLGKWYRCHLTGQNPFAGIFLCILNGVLISLCFMTIGRTALTVMIFNTLLAVFLMTFSYKKRKLLNLVLRLSGVFLAFALSLPIAFGLARYVPARLSSPMLLTGDKLYEKISPYGFSPDDERLITLEMLKEEALGRFGSIRDNQLFQFFQKKETGSSAFPKLYLKAEAAKKKKSNKNKNKDLRGSGDSREDPLYYDKSKVTEKNVRFEIYKVCLKRTNFVGRKNSEGGFWLTRARYYDHAHNIILQILYYFGWIPGILFGALCFLALIYYTVRCMNPKLANCRLIICTLLLSSFLLFGMLEVDWRVGQMSFTFFFLSLYYLFQRRKGTPSSSREAKPAQTARR